PGPVPPRAPPPPSFAVRARSTGDPRLPSAAFSGGAGGGGGRYNGGPMPLAHLLVVDDEASILTTLQKALSLEGYAVDVAGGVKVAEEKLRKRTYDLCLFDVMLPDGDGLGLLEKLRAAKNDTPIIMMSGHATIDAAVRAVRVGALNF